MISKEYVILIPGLGDNTKLLQLITAHWKKHNVITIIHNIGWRDYSSDFKTKFAKLLAQIDNLVTEGNKVSIVGTSAGGSAALNAFMERKQVVNKIINVCGRLRVGPTKGLRAFSTMTSTSPAFALSVINCDEQLNKLTDDERARIMTLHPRFGDELVPPETTIVDGATNIALPTGEHVFSIFYSLTILSNTLLTFLLEK